MLERNRVRWCSCGAEAWGKMQTGRMFAAAALGRRMRRRRLTR